MSGNHDNFSDFDVNYLSITNFKFIRRKLGYGLKKNSSCEREIFLSIEPIRGSYTKLNLR